MLWNVIEWAAIAATRVIGWLLLAFTMGKLVGEILGKRHSTTYVHEFLDRV